MQGKEDHRTGLSSTSRGVRLIYRLTNSGSTLLWPGLICEEISEWNVNKSGNSSLHLRAKGGVVPPSVHI
jgi:hypothetical protein